MKHGVLWYVRKIGPLSIVLLSVVFLMGDFCEDVFSIPLEVDFVSEPISLTVSFGEAPEGMDGDVDMDSEIPEGELEGDNGFEWREEGYDISIQRMTIDFNDPDLGVAGIDKYKGNLVGIFVRSVTYEIKNNNIPGNIPPLKVYLAPEPHSTDGLEDTYNWDAAIGSGEIQDWQINGDLPNDGLGERGVVMLGTTENYIWDPPVQDFPTAERRLIRQTANIDEISDTILSNFQFEALIVPTAPVKIDEEDRDQIPDNLQGEVDIILHFVVVVIAKA